MRLKRLALALAATLLLAGCFMEHCEWTPDAASPAGPDAADEG